METKAVKMDAKTINWITNVIAILLAILEPVKSYLTTQPFDWATFAICVGSAIIGWFTGKSTISTLKGQ